MMTWYQLDWHLEWRLHPPESVPDLSPSWGCGFRGRLLYLWRQTFLTTETPHLWLSLSSLSPCRRPAKRQRCWVEFDPQSARLWARAQRVSISALGFHPPGFPNLCIQSIPVLFYTSWASWHPALGLFTTQKLPWFDICLSSPGYREDPLKWRKSNCKT